MIRAPSVTETSEMATVPGAKPSASGITKRISDGDSRVSCSASWSPTTTRATFAIDLPRIHTVRRAAVPPLVRLSQVATGSGRGVGVGVGVGVGADAGVGLRPEPIGVGEGAVLETGPSPAPRA